MATKTAAREVDPIENPGDFDTSPGPIGNGPIFDAPVRTVLDDIKDAVEAYPTTYVKLEIVDIEKDGDIVNTGEEVRFHVKVTNDGPMTMKDVRLKAVAKNGTEVKSGRGRSRFRDGSSVGPTPSKPSAATAALMRPARCSSSRRRTPPSPKARCWPR